jgi:lipopolysaccharide transport system ATP-binding protein
MKAIQVEHLAKKYHLGGDASSASSVREAVMGSVKNAVRRLMGKSAAVDSPSDFWALKDVSFDVEPGDRIGIIGRNGAGKSTLLKVLSRITEPTRGRAVIRGSVASLLEVGTGFHPELTGRENVFLNGAILGMSQAEIRAKFDEIVAFAEVEKFLDTPVKHYSSGMYVRLAFAVAAHLEPEILIVDEVLAVGDLRFQEKCLGKMRSIGGEGRTILFVTHQMGMVSQLCNRALLLEEGQIIKEGAPDAVVSAYLRRGRAGQGGHLLRDASYGRDKAIALAEAFTTQTTGAEASEFGHDEPVVLEVRAGIQKFISGTHLGAVVKDRFGRKVFTSQVALEAQGVRSSSRGFSARMTIPASFLAPGEYSFLIALHVPNVEALDQVDEVCRFRIVDTGSVMAIHDGVDYGCVQAPCTWEVKVRDVAA